MSYDSLPYYFTIPKSNDVWLSCLTLKQMQLSRFIRRTLSVSRHGLVEREASIRGILSLSGHLECHTPQNFSALAKLDDRSWSAITVLIVTLFGLTLPSPKHAKKIYFLMLSPCFDILFLKCWRKKCGPIFKELLKFFPKKLSLSSQKYRFGWDPGSGKNLFQIPDPRSSIQGSKRHRIQDPGSGSATLPTIGGKVLADWYSSYYM